MPTYKVELDDVTYTIRAPNERLAKQEAIRAATARRQKRLRAGKSAVKQPGEKRG